MRSCLSPGVLAALLVSLTTVSTAQIDTPRPARGYTPPKEAPVEPAIPAAVPRMGGVTVPLNSKLTAGDIITVEIKEDHDPVLITVVTDTGEVELNGLGRVYVAGRSSAEAAALVATYLKQKFYHQATVEIGIKTKIAGGVDNRPFKVVISGKVGRPGPQLFFPTNPLKLTEAVIVAGSTLYSDLRKVRLTRGGQSADHNVELIMKEGRTDLDVSLRDGDVIYVPTKSGLIFTNSN
jgi:protein involved in polysaccharide export with SLBB domain